MVLAASVVSAVLTPVHWALASAPSFVLIWLLMSRWFDADLLGVIVTLVLWWLLRMWVAMAILAALAA